jgi:uncharacterized protein YegP (UPF0339 family)
MGLFMKHPKVEFFKGADNKWRWRMVAANGRQICSPGESFSSRSKAEYNFECVETVIHAGVETHYLKHGEQ